MSGTDLAIVGLGPWGLSVLERLVQAVRGRNGSSPTVRVHVVEPGAPGSGVYAVGQPDYLILNTPCGQHSMHPFTDEAGTPTGRGFYDWVRVRGYRWMGDTCRISSTGREIQASDFLPRRLMGEYLEWFYRSLLADAPPSLQVHHHASEAVDVVGPADGRQHVVLADRTVLEVDHVVLTTGYSPNLSEGRRDESGPLKPYPVDVYRDTVPPGAAVAVGGMGLVALDVVMALTNGRGGTFVGEDRLRYRPSGREPTIALFSRSGYPYCAKSMGTEDPTGEYRPVICTPEAVASMQGGGPGSPGRLRVDARRDLMPLVFAEMQTRFYSQAVRLRHGPAAAAEIEHRLGDSWARGTYNATVGCLARWYGEFDPASHFYVGDGEQFVSSKDYEAQVYSLIDSDLAEASVRGGASPVKAAYEVLRVLRDTMRSVVEYRGLTADSYRDFQSTLRTKITRLVAGPPAFRSQQLLALMDAGVLRMPFGPSPRVDAVDQGVVVGSRYLDRPHEERCEWFIQGHFDDPSLSESASPLLRSMYEGGRLRELSYDGVAVGSVDLSEEFHPINVMGDCERRLWVLGALSEGVRHFTHYIPSPKSRVRAFVDAQSCVEQMLVRGGAR